MAYTKTTWVDRVVEFANRFVKSNETSTSVTLTADPGVVTEEGTPLSATNMNKIEQGIADVDAARIAHEADTMPHQFVDGITTYRYGLKLNATSDGLVFVYEEVV